MLRGLPRRPGNLLAHALRGLAVGVVAALAAHFAVVLGGSNFRTVLPGRVYRSGQLSPARLDAYARKHGIRTVINLRGCCPTADWYRLQAEATAGLDIAQEDVSFSATRMPSSASLRQLVEVLDRCEYPVLFHCHQGADRTGMASAVALLLHTDTPLEEATRQLGLASGHVPLGRTAAIDHLFVLYREWLAEEGLDHSRAAFRLWAVGCYCPGVGSAALELIDPPAGPFRLRQGEQRKVTVRCRNTSEAAWRFEPGPSAGIHGFWRLLDADERSLFEGRTGLRRATVRPGGTIDLEVALPPLPPGRYALWFDLMEEQHATFLQLGNEMLVVDVEVAP